MISAAVGASVFPVGVPKAAAAELASHRAYYRLTLGEMRNSSGLLDISGALAISLEKTCDGWITSHRMSMTSRGSGGQEAKQEIRFATWEATDGKSYRFAYRDAANPGLPGFKGEARMIADGTEIEVRYTAPTEKRVMFDADTMFPVGLVQSLIKGAENGERQLEMKYFDGQAGTGVLRVVTFVNGEAEPATGDVESMGALVGAPGWRLRMGYYPVADRSGAPLYEADIVQLSNGVARSVELDYGDYTLDLELDSIEEIPEPKC